MKVLVVDKFPAAGLDRLKGLGFDVAYLPEAKGEAFVSAVRESAADGLVVRSTKVTEEVLAAGTRLSLVVRAGSGYDNIDVPACSRRGIFVATCPGRNATAVAELTIGLMLALDRRIPDNVADLRQKKWNKKEYSQARGIHGRVLGLLGVGTIGQLVAARARALGMRVVGWDKFLPSERAEAQGVELLGQPDDVAAFSDVVSVHLALNDETRGVCGPTFFDAMRPGSFFINTSRGEIVDELALLKAIESRGIRAALDVFNKEPAQATAEFDNALAQHAKVYGTHHIGASTEQAQDAIADETVRVLREFRDSGRAPNTVNLARQSPATHVLTVRHLDRVGVLAHVLNGLRAAGVNVQEMENVVFDGAEAAIARIHLDHAVSATVMDTIQKDNKDIMELKLLSLARPPAK
ncbi:MAG: hydroxyacid dehydrogenase [Deltaproteobacteria bacterium]|nr:hydroxyacid dehydrogenase [Deltaproteobacteria bacterium]